MEDKKSCTSVVYTSSPFCILERRIYFRINNINCYNEHDDFGETICCCYSEYDNGVMVNSIQVLYDGDNKITDVAFSGTSFF